MLISEYIEYAPRAKKYPEMYLRDSLDIQLNMEHNYHMRNILIKDYLITSRYFHRLWIAFFCSVCFTTIKPKH